MRKNMTSKIFKLIVLFLITQSQLMGQVFYENERFVPETDSLVLKKLDQWQDKKFGLLMVWGIYSQWGIVESWSLCPDLVHHRKRGKPKNPDNYFAYKKEYEELKNTFNPINFNPEKWSYATSHRVDEDGNIIPIE